MARVLLIDDDVDLCQFLMVYLSQDDFEVDCVHDGVSALGVLKKDDYELAILDVMLPDTSGIDLLKQIQQQYIMPVVMLSARGEEVDRIVGLEIGADDYIPKPCNPRELVARMRSVLRRSAEQAKPLGSDAVFGPLRIDGALHQVFVADEPLQLTNAEYNIIKYLVGMPKQVIAKEELFKVALRRDMEDFDRSLDVHISHLRQKLLKAEVANQIQIKTVRGLGFMLEETH